MKTNYEPSIVNSFTIDNDCDISTNVKFRNKSLSAYAYFSSWPKSLQTLNGDKGFFGRR